jgi:N6-adenosine-specific RNA methylase IME4
MGDAEFMLLGTRGKICGYQPRPRNQRTVYDALVPKVHSRKPALFHELIEARFVCDVSRLELFATQERAGWTTIGNAINGLDINESVARLVEL